MTKETKEQTPTSKCWEFELDIQPTPFGADVLEPKTITTFVYSDTGKDIEQRFTPHKVSNIREITDPNADVLTNDSGWRTKKYGEYA